MKQRILIAGSGRMALDMGLFFLQKQYPVVFVSPSRERLDLIAEKVEKVRKRLKRFVPEKNTRLEAGYFHPDAPGLPTVDILIETTVESLREKQYAIQRLRRCLGREGLLLSNSSSLLPQSIDPRCIGLHFFYPVNLTRLVELILPETASKTEIELARKLCRDTGLSVIEQDESSAFAVNRLLAPLQALSMEALNRGGVPEIIDDGSRGGLLPLGQLSLMDSIGLDVVHAAVTCYHQRYRFPAGTDVAILLSGLGQVVQSGKLGKKNNNGLLSGEPLPWGRVEWSRDERDAFTRECSAALIASCRDALERKMVTRDQLQMIFEQVYHANGLPDSLALC